MWYDDDLTPEEVLDELKGEYERRKAKNPNYSIRAYALFLEIDQSALTRLLNDKRSLSWTIGKQIIEKLKLKS